MTKRERLYPEIKRLREDEGLKWREIGERVGLSKSAVHEYYADPTAEKVHERKAKGIRACVDCGAPCNTDGSVTDACERCAPCSAKANGAARKVWTREAIIAAIEEWNAIHGEHPRVCDWNPTQARRLGRALHPAYVNEPERWPHYQTVLREFGVVGGWARAMRAAGFEPRGRGGGAHRSKSPVAA
jgi:hypothetical protein